MCGRFTLTSEDYRAVAEAFEAALESFDPAGYRPRYNVAPTDPHPIVATRDGTRCLQWGKWGLVSPWSRGNAKPPILINVRSEQLGTHRGFRNSLLHHRCVVPADGFFEWTGPKTVRLPFWFHTPQPQPFGFAGLYRDVADPKTGETQRTFTILTTRANELVAAAHHRMPAVLEPATIPLWLSPPPTSSLDHEAFVRSLTDALAPAANDRLVATPVSARVNDVRNDDPACLEEGQPEGQLELPSQGPEK